jgi:hypothetical protein
VEVGAKVILCESVHGWPMYVDTWSERNTLVCLRRARVRRREGGGRNPGLADADETKGAKREACELVDR